MVDFEKKRNEFGGSIFSSYDIRSWKPEPGLFLHAAKGMNFPAERCVVIEDSEVGIDAAKAAGMTAMHYKPNGTTLGQGEFSHMAQLNALLS